MILAAVLILQPSWKVLAEEVQTDQNVSEEAEMTEEEKQAAEEKEKQRIYRYHRRVCGKTEWKYENTTSNSRKYNGKCKKGMK